MVQDHGWGEDGTIWIAYRLTAATLSSGVVTIPAALKKLVNGSFRLMSEEGAEMGTLVAKDTSAWGLSPFFRRRGGEEGDTLLVTLDLGQREAVARLGDEELRERASDIEGTGEAAIEVDRRAKHLSAEIPAKSQASFTAPPARTRKCS